MERKLKSALMVFLKMADFCPFSLDEVRYSFANVVSGSDTAPLNDHIFQGHKENVNSDDAFMDEAYSDHQSGIDQGFDHQPFNYSDEGTNLEQEVLRPLSRITEDLDNESVNSNNRETIPEQTLPRTIESENNVRGPPLERLTLRDRVQRELCRLQEELEQEKDHIQQHQVKQAELEHRIQVWQLRLVSDLKDSRLIDSESGGITDGRPASWSGNTTLVGTPIAHSMSKDPTRPLSARMSKHPTDVGHYLESSNPAKRKRASLLSLRKFTASPIIYQDSSAIPVAASTSTPGTAQHHHRLSKNRLSQAFQNIHFGTYGKQVTCAETDSDILITNSARPKSYPLSRRWRRSLGVSVKTLTEKFEILKTGL